MNRAVTAIVTGKNEAMVFDSTGEQIPELQGPFPLMREKILQNMSPSGVILGEETVSLLESITRRRENGRM